VNVLIGASNRGKVILGIADIAGRTMIQQMLNIEAGSNTILVDLSRLPHGIYIVKLACGSKCDSNNIFFGSHIISVL
jgi:hypothetical protein